MPIPEMNRIQRRLWRAFMATGADTTAPDAVARLHRLVDDHVAIMSPALRHVMQVALSKRVEVDYDELAHLVMQREGIHLSPAAIRKRVSRAVAIVERAIASELAWGANRPRPEVPHLELRAVADPRRRRVARGK
jgi:hypothetical protein